MESLVITDVSWGAVLTGAVLIFVLGWFWYSSFATAFMDAHGIPMPEDPSGQRPAAINMILQIISNLLLSWLVAIFYMTIFVHGQLRGILALFVVLYVLDILTGYLWHMKAKPYKAWMIDSGNLIVSILVLVGVNYAFRMWG